MSKHGEGACPCLPFDAQVLLTCSILGTIFGPRNPLSSVESLQEFFLVIASYWLLQKGIPLADDHECEISKDILT